MKLRKEESGNCSFWSDKQRTEHKKHFKNHMQLRVSKQEREKERQWQRVKWRDGEQQQKIKISFISCWKMKLRDRGLHQVHHNSYELEM